MYTVQSYQAAAIQVQLSSIQVQQVSNSITAVSYTSTAVSYSRTAVVRQVLLSTIKVLLPAVCKYSCRYTLYKYSCQYSKTVAIQVQLSAIQVRLSTYKCSYKLYSIQYTITTFSYSIQVYSQLSSYSCLLSLTIAVIYTNWPCIDSWPAVKCPGVCMCVCVCEVMNPRGISCPPPPWWGPVPGVRPDAPPLPPHPLPK